MMSSDNGQRLQKTVPSIMQVRSDEKPIVTGPTLKEIMLSAAVKNTSAIVMFSRFVFELNSFSNCVKRKPINAPSESDNTISMTGFSTIASTLTSPPAIVFEMPNNTAKTTRPTASSSATIGRRRLVSSPFALYCRTTMRVAAGAVAVAIAESVSTCGSVIASGKNT